MKRCCLVVVFLAIGLSTARVGTPQTPPTVTIGIVVDGPWSGNEGVIQLFLEEITDLLVGEFDPRFPPSATIIGDWTPSGVEGAVDQLLSDPSIDLVITLGVLASHFAAGRTDLPKPVFVPIVIDPALQGLPQRDGTSGMKNLNYLALPLTFERDVTAFWEIVDFESLAILVNARVATVIPALGERSGDRGSALGIRTTVIPVEDAESALARQLRPRENKPERSL